MNEIVCFHLKKLGKNILSTFMFFNANEVFGIYQNLERPDLKNLTKTLESLRSVPVFMIHNNKTKLEKMYTELLQTLFSFAKEINGQSFFNQSKETLFLLTSKMLQDAKLFYSTSLTLLHDRTVVFPLLAAFTTYLEKPFSKIKIKLKNAPFCRISTFSFEQLELTGPKNTLECLLNGYTKTQQGKAEVERNLKQPLISVSKIKARQHKMIAINKDFGLKSSLAELLKKTPNFLKIAISDAEIKLGLEEMAVCEKLIEKGYSMLPFFASIAYNNLCKENTFPFANKLKTIKKKMAPLLEMLKLTFKEPVGDGSVKVNESFSEDLVKLNSSLEKLEKQCKRHFEVKIEEKLGADLFSLTKLENTSKGFLVRITRKNENKLRPFIDHRFLEEAPEESENFFVVETKKDGVRLCDKVLQTLNKAYLSLNEKYREIQKSIVKEAVAVIHTYNKLFLIAAAFFGKLDFYFSLAELSSKEGFVQPLVLPKEDKLLSYTLGRHVLLENNTSFIANGLLLSSEKRFVLVTGPNTGGKSTFLKQTALLVVLMQIGSFLPITSGSFSVFTEVISRIGASDCPEEGTSTFFAEMLETSVMLNHGTEHSLLIIDELGRGTSVKEGYVLAKSICRFICEKLRCLCMFATHFHELYELNTEMSSVILKKVLCEIDEQGLKPLYRVEDGKCSDSLGIEVAKKLGFSDEFLKTAYQVAEFIK